VVADYKAYLSVLDFGLYQKLTLAFYGQYAIHHDFPKTSREGIDTQSFLSNSLYCTLGVTLLTTEKKTKI